MNSIQVIWNKIRHRSKCMSKSHISNLLGLLIICACLFGTYQIYSLHNGSKEPFSLEDLSVFSLAYDILILLSIPVIHSFSNKMDNLEDKLQVIQSKLPQTGKESSDEKSLKTRTGLQPCPYCGEYFDEINKVNWNDNLRFSYEGLGNGVELWRMWCMKCDSYGPMETSRIDALKSWNKRGE